MNRLRVLIVFAAIFTITACTQQEPPPSHAVVFDFDPYDEPNQLLGIGRFLVIACLAGIPCAAAVLVWETRQWRTWRKLAVAALPMILAVRLFWWSAEVLVAGVSVDSDLRAEAEAEVERVLEDDHEVLDVPADAVEWIARGRGPKDADRIETTGRIDGQLAYLTFAKHGDAWLLVIPEETRTP